MNKIFIPRLSYQRKNIFFYFLVNIDPMRQFLQIQNFLRSKSGFKFVLLKLTEGRIMFHYVQFVHFLWIAKHHLKQESIHLSFWKRIDTLTFDRILVSHHKKGPR